MRVLVDALPLRNGGGVSYLQQQLAALARIAPDLTIHNLVAPWSQLQDLPGTTEVVPVRAVTTRFVYELSRLPLRKTDVLYCPANFGPVISRAPMVLTLHNPNYYGTGLRLAEARSSRPFWKVKANHLAMRHADAVIAISHSFAADVIETVPSVAEKLRVIPSGAPEWPEESKAVCGLPERYILVVASSAPHKRVHHAVAGWTRSLDRCRDSVSLVIVGAMSPDMKRRLRDIGARHADQLHFTGELRDRRQLKWIYERATAMVSMSALEAFPLTPAEAGSLGCPLVLSDIPPHREVAGGNAQLVPLSDADALADVLAEDVYRLAPGSRRWEWPVKWDAHARDLQATLEQAAR